MDLILFNQKFPSVNLVSRAFVNFTSVSYNLTINGESENQSRVFYRWDKHGMDYSM